MEAIEQILNGISIRQIETHIKRLEGIRHPTAAPEALEKAADYIWEILTSYGYEMLTHYFDEGDRQYRNIIATLNGIQQSDKRVIVLAHYDTVSTSPGANDNASGVAALLELGRIFELCRFRKTIQFVAVSLEEQMVEGEKGSPCLRGSRALATHAHENGWDIEGVIDFEEIGYAGETVEQLLPENFPLEKPEAGNFIAIVGNQNSAGLVNGYIQAIERYKLSLPYLPIVVPGNGEMFPDVRRSDHASFWDEGYPAIMITDTANLRTPHYHQPSDVLATLNLPFATEVCRAAGGLVLDLAIRIY